MTSHLYILIRQATLPGTVLIPVNTQSDTLASLICLHYIFAIHTAMAAASEKQYKFSEDDQAQPHYICVFIVKYNTRIVST